MSYNNLKSIVSDERRIIRTLGDPGGRIPLDVESLRVYLEDLKGTKEDIESWRTQLEITRPQT